MSRPRAPIGLPAGFPLSPGCHMRPLTRFTRRSGSLSISSIPSVYLVASSVVTKLSPFAVTIPQNVWLGITFKKVYYKNVYYSAL
jgi:hypothetical protein